MLPSNLTVDSVYLDYQKACASTGAELHSETTFRRIWKSPMPTLIMAKPSTSSCDLCWQCQQNNMRYLGHSRHVCYIGKPTCWRRGRPSC